MTIADRVDIESLIRRGRSMTFSREYNCDLRRLLPWPGHVNTKRPLTEFGCIWVVVKPGTDVDAHSHDEEELFIVLSGQAELALGENTTLIESGDVIYIPRFAHHQLRNRSQDTPLVMLDLYWDAGGRSDSTFA